MRGQICLAALLLLIVGASFAFADEPFYLYQRGYFGAQGDISLETETAYGNRETRLLGADVVEQGLRVRVAGTDWLSFEGWGGFALRTDENAEGDGRDSAVSGDVFARVLNQERQFVNLSLGLGYLYDYGQNSIPRARLTVGRQWRDFDLSFSTLAEMPLTEEKEREEEAEAEGEEEEEAGAYDEVDLIFSAAFSYGLTDWMRLGAESVLEDAEGFWDTEEAEGGAKMLLGPTAYFAATDNMFVRLNAASVIPLTSNQQTRVPGGATNNGPGFLGRIALGYTFR